MKNQLLSSDDVLKKIGASDFRSITKSQLVEFVSSIPEMDKETAIKCIEQFPEFRSHAKEIVGELYSVCNNIMENGRESQVDAINAYKTILDDLGQLLERDSIDENERFMITERMVEVADRIAELHREHNHFLQNLAAMASCVAGLALTIGGTLLGVKMIDRK